MYRLAYVKVWCDVMWCCLMRLNWDERKDGCATCRNAIWSNLPTVVLLTRLTCTQMCGHMILAHSSSSYHLLSTHILNRTIDWEFRFNDKGTGTQVKRSVCMSVGPALLLTVIYPSVFPFDWIAFYHFSCWIRSTVLYRTLLLVGDAAVTDRIRLAHPPPPSIDTHLLIKFTHQQLYHQMVS